MEKTAAALLAECVRAAGAAGEIVPVSGWRPRAQQDVYKRQGMTCSACSAHVEKAVRRVAGVRDVTVCLLYTSFHSGVLPWI